MSFLSRRKCLCGAANAPDRNKRKLRFGLPARFDKGIRAGLTYGIIDINVSRNKKTARRRSLCSSDGAAIRLREEQHRDCFGDRP